MDAEERVSGVGDLVSGVEEPGAATAAPLGGGPPTNQVNLVPAGKIAAALGVSDQSIYNWSKVPAPRGIPVAAVSPEGMKWYDVDACKAWHSAVKRRGVGSGGKRRGAGRRKGLGTGGWGLRAEPGTLAAAASASPPPPLPLSVPSPQPPAPDLPMTEAERATFRLKTAQAAASEYELEVKRGKFVEKEPMLAAWREQLQRIVMRLEGIGARAGPMLVAAVSLDPTCIPEVERVVAGLVRDAMDEISGGMGLGAGE